MLIVIRMHSYLLGCHAFLSLAILPGSIVVLSIPVLTAKKLFETVRVKTCQ